MPTADTMYQGGCRFQGHVVEGSALTPEGWQGHTLQVSGAPGKSQLISSLEQVARQLGSDGWWILRPGAPRGLQSWAQCSSYSRIPLSARGWVLPSRSSTGTSLSFFLSFSLWTFPNIHKREECMNFFVPIHQLQTYQHLPILFHPSPPHFLEGKEELQSEFFEAYPRHHILSLINTSVCISNR